MGIKIIAREWKAGTNECRCKFICDTDADFENLPEALAGSTAISLWSKKERVVNTKGKWVPYGEGFISAPIIDLVKEGGGTLDYGKEATLKNKITEEEITNYLDGVGFEIQTDEAQSTLMYTLEGGTLMIGWSNGALIPEEAGYHVMVLPNEAEITGTGYAYLAGFPSYPDGGWYAINMVAGQIIPWSTPMTVAFATPDPDRPYMATPNFELLSVFFNLETAVSLVVTDTNDEGIVASYEVYADEALVDTVPKAETIDATALGVTAGASVTVKAKSIIDTTSKASNAVIFE